MAAIEVSSNRSLVSPATPSKIEEPQHTGIIMAPHCPAAKMTTDRHRELLETAYDGLRRANEQLQNAEIEICRLMVAKMVGFWEECEPQHKSKKREYERRGFGDQGPHTEDWSDWWQRTIRTYLLESVDIIDRELDRMNAHKSEIEAFQSTFRRNINELSRPYLRNLSILDFPDEILLGIFELVEGLPLPIFGCEPRNPEDIKNTRLVCRRFCDVSSQLLVRHVRVSFNEPSLARLEEISRHPTIAKGVRAIRVVLHLYTASFTDPKWLSYHACGIEIEANNLRQDRLKDADKFRRAHLLEEADKVEEIQRMSEQTVSKMIADGMTVASALRRLASSDPDDGAYSEDDNDHRARLAKARQEYSTLFKNQESMIGKLSRVVGSAMARMPGARKLEFRDEDSQAASRDRYVMDVGDVWDSVHRRMLQPTNGWEVGMCGFKLPNYHCLLDVMDSVRSAGVLLHSIDIHLTILGTPGALVPDPDTRQEFSSSMRQLKNFAFTSSAYLREENADDLNEFLSAFLDTSSLKTLSLYMRGQV